MLPGQQLSLAQTLLLASTMNVTGGRVTTYKPLGIRPVRYQGVSLGRERGCTAYKTALQPRQSQSQQKPTFLRAGRTPAVTSPPRADITR